MSGDPSKKPAAAAPIDIPEKLLLAVFRAARAAFPAECCGWLTGPADGAAVTDIRPCVNAQVDGDHPEGQGRSPDQSYVIAGDDLLAFSRGFREPSPPRVIYHSHPNGRAYFSAMDREVAKSPWGDGPAFPVQQLVVGLDAQRVAEAALFAWSDEADDFVEIARFPGSAL